MFERRHPQGSDNAGTYSVYLCIHGEDRDNACCVTKKITTAWAKNSPICRAILDTGPPTTSDCICIRRSIGSRQKPHNVESESDLPSKRVIVHRKSCRETVETPDEGSRSCMRNVNIYASISGDECEIWGPSLAEPSTEMGRSSKLRGHVTLTTPTQDLFCFSVFPLHISALIRFCWVRVMFLFTTHGRRVLPVLPSSLQGLKINNNNKIGWAGTKDFTGFRRRPWQQSSVLVDSGSTALNARELYRGGEPPGSIYRESVNIFL